MIVKSAGAEAMRNDDRGAQLISQRFGHFSADHSIEQIIERSPFGKSEILPLAVFIVLEII